MVEDAFAQNLTEWAKPVNKRTFIVEGLINIAEGFVWFVKVTCRLVSDLIERLSNGSISLTRNFESKGQYHASGRFVIGMGSVAQIP